MRTALLAMMILPVLSAAALADDKPTRPQHIESQSDLGFDVGGGAFAQRFLGRLVLNDLDYENRAEMHYGLAWKPSERFSLDLTAGYAYAHDGPTSHHGLVIGLWKNAAFLRGTLRLHGEALYRYDGASRFDGFYSVDWWVVGLHAENRGRDFAAGFQTGSGPGLLPFRFDIRIAFGLTDGMPDRSARFVMSFDVR